MIDITRIRKKAKKLKEKKTDEEKLKEEERLRSFSTKKEKKKPMKKESKKETGKKKRRRTEEVTEPGDSPETHQPETTEQEKKPLQPPQPDVERLDTEKIEPQTPFQPLDVDTILARLFSPIPGHRMVVASMGLTSAAQQEGNQYFVFKLHHEWYAIPLDVVKEIVRFRPFTRIPRAPSEILGVMNLRGQMIPIINSYARLHLPSPDVWTLKHRVIMVRDKDDTMGFVIENVANVTYIEDDALKPAPMHIAREKSHLIKNVFHFNQYVVSVIDLNEFFNLETESVSR